MVPEPSHHAVGRSRGGLTAKVPALTDGRGRAQVVLLTAGKVNDITMFAPLLAALRVTRNGPSRPRTNPDQVVGDKGYSSRANRTLLRRRGIAHTIPEPCDHQANRRRKGSAGGRPVGFDAARYARRCAVDCGFGLLKQWRDLATRYDEHPRNDTGALNLGAPDLTSMIRRALPSRSSRRSRGPSPHAAHRSLGRSLALSVSGLPGARPRGRQAVPDGAGRAAVAAAP